MPPHHNPTAATDIRAGGKAVRNHLITSKYLVLTWPTARRSTPSTEDGIVTFHCEADRRTLDKGWNGHDFLGHLSLFSGKTVVPKTRNDPSYDGRRPS